MRRIDFLRVGVVEDVEALGISLHDAVFDAVVHHLDEVAGAGRPAVEIAVFSRALIGRTAGCAADVALSWSRSFENRLNLLEGVRFGADHQAVAAINAPDAAAGADIGVANALGFEG